jgi:hypothetical protein
MTETKPMNRIMIYGPKEDGTYVVEFKTAAGEALAISRAEKRSHRAQALPGQDAVWAGGAGRRRDPVSAPGQARLRAHAADTKRAAGSRFQGFGRILRPWPNLAPRSGLRPGQ